MRTITLNKFFILLAKIKPKTWIAIFVSIDAGFIGGSWNYPYIMSHFNAGNSLERVQGVFVIFEILTLTLLTFFSTRNFIIAVDHHNKLPIKGRILFCAFVNLLLFIFAVVTLASPYFLILTIIAIYAVFQYCNFSQIMNGIKLAKIVKLEKEKLKYRKYVIEHYGFLREENYPSFIGYTVIFCISSYRPVMLYRAPHYSN